MSYGERPRLSGGAQKRIISDWRGVERQVPYSVDDIDPPHPDRQRERNALETRFTNGQSGLKNQLVELQGMNNDTAEELITLISIHVFRESSPKAKVATQAEWRYKEQEANIHREADERGQQVVTFINERAANLAATKKVVREFYTETLDFKPPVGL
ncbi:MAG: hypothetical protein HYV32_04460 [Candidatus Kerfeldbacteria bacterium]|nr:hypothetical protein [Candidatus Kerfeldbacteria bacterium]